MKEVKKWQKYWPTTNSWIVFSFYQWIHIVHYEAKDTKRQRTKEPWADTHLTPSLTPLQLHNVPQPKHKMYINFKVHLGHKITTPVLKTFHLHFFFYHLTRHLKSYLNVLLKKWANSEAGCPKRLWNLQSWRYLENNSEKSQVNICKFQINITFGQSTELPELQSFPET